MAAEGEAVHDNAPTNGNVVYSEKVLHVLYGIYISAEDCLQSCHGRVRFGNASETRLVHLRTVGARQMRLNNVKGSFSLGAMSEMDHHDAAANAENDFPFFAKESANTGIAGN